MLAEAVVHMLTLQIQNGTHEMPCNLVVSASHLGPQSCLRIAAADIGRIVWVFSRKLEGGIRVILADRHLKGYDMDIVPKPNFDSEDYDFMEDEVGQAALCILSFFKRPTSTPIKNIK
jgi:hypothetical protein